VAVINRHLADRNPTESIRRNDIDICAAPLAERPYLTSGRHVVHEKANCTSAARTLNLHVKNFVLLPEKGGIDAHA
jgi:FAD synthase